MIAKVPEGIQGFPDPASVYEIKNLIVLCIEFRVSHSPGF